MDKDQHASAKPGNSTLRKSKRRNRKKKPSNVSAADNNPPIADQPPTVANKPATNKLPAKSSSAPKAAAKAAPVPVVNASTDLKEATAQVLQEVKKVFAEIIPIMEKKVAEDKQKKVAEETKKAEAKTVSGGKKVAEEGAKMAAEEKDRDLVKAEREAKRLAKKNKKQGGETSTTPSEASGKPKQSATIEKTSKVPTKVDRPETGPKQKLPSTSQSAPEMTKSNTDTDLATKLEKLHLAENNPPGQDKPQLTKAERRAIQEAQRAAKAKALAEKSAKPTATASGKKPADPVKEKEAPKAGHKVSPKISSSAKKVVEIKKHATHRVKLFSHLYLEKKAAEDLLTEESTTSVHPAIIQLGVQQSEGTIIGANSRCIAFLNALKLVISDFVPPPQKIFSRSLEALIQSSMVYLQKCRPISVSMANALKAIKGQINHLPDNETDDQHKETLCEFIDTYIRDQIEKAAVAISKKVQEKICTGDVILTYGCSSLIKHILDDAHRRNVDFRVIVVDSRPLNEGQEMLRRLTAEGIRCSCVLINAVSFVMPEVTKVLLGAHALLANGYVMSRTGTAQVAMVAKSYNVPVLVCCETHKFSERVQTDAFVYNEIGDPDDLVAVTGVEEDAFALKGWQTLPHLTPLHLYYDVTPPELVAAVVTEVAILPCTSVPVILRIKPTEVWY